MLYLLLADILVVLHLVFICFVLFGALLVLKWPQTVWFHLPACIWGITVEFTGCICPLTPLEIELRLMAGEKGYSEGFVTEYLMSIIYPAGLTREIQWILGGIVVLINLVLYTMVLKRRKFFS